MATSLLPYFIGARTIQILASILILRPAFVVLAARDVVTEARLRLQDAVLTDVVDQPIRRLVQVGVQHPRHHGVHGPVGSLVLNKFE